MTNYIYEFYRLFKLPILIKNVYFMRNATFNFQAFAIMRKAIMRNAIMRNTIM